LSLLLFFLVGVTATPEPHPAALERAKQAFRHAEAAFDAGDFARALEGYRAAYAYAPEPELLYNAGQAQRNLGRWADAIVSFERYLTEERDAPDRAQVRALIQQLRARLEGEPPRESALEAPWLWAVAGALVVAGSAAAIVMATRDGPPTRLPMGTLGTFDFR
jgi:tetratricopeptide (TPR) repeat protein